MNLQAYRVLQVCNTFQATNSKTLWALFDGLGPIRSGNSSNDYPRIARRNPRIARRNPRIARRSFSNAEKFQAFYSLQLGLTARLDFYSSSLLKRVLHRIRSHKITGGPAFLRSPAPVRRKLTMEKPRAGLAGGA